MASPTPMQQKAIDLADKWFRSNEKTKRPFILTGYAGTGKAEDVDTLLPTPNGFKRMGDIQVGDLVFDRLGKPTKVLEIHPQGELDVYKVELGDGRYMYCNDEHLFTTFTSKNNFKVRSVRDMLNAGLDRITTAKSGRVQYNSKYYIPTNGPVEYIKYSDEDLKLDPYVLGAFIGDGSLTNQPLIISSDDEFVVNKISKIMNFEYRRLHTSNYNWGFKFKKTILTENSLGHQYERQNVHTSDLFNENFMLLANEKYIPEEYKYNSLNNRIKLLQGLFDTDGSVYFGDNRLKVRYSTSSEVLAGDVRELLLSIGLGSTIRIDNRDNGKRVYYEVNVNAKNQDKLQLFTLPRKKEIIEDNLDLDIRRRYDRVPIVSIQKMGYTKKMQCISVDNEEELYLTNDFIVTHNTWTISRIVEKLNLHADQVKFVSFTGMAASVMSKNGNPATTIHKLIYDPVPLKNGGVKFELKDSLPGDIKLIIVDEFSTVGNNLMEDLESFKIPIILTGDPFQLPPVKSKENKYINKSDITLTEVMRQALDNPIIYIATQIRKGERVEFGNYDDKVMVLSKDDLDLEHIAWADQILANRNVTVDQFNNLVRDEIYQLDTPFPHVGEKLLCLKNDWSKFIKAGDNDQYLVNGLLGIVEDIGDYQSSIDAFDIDFRPLFLNTDNKFETILTDGIYFSEGIKDDNPLFLDKELKDKYKKTLIRRKSLEDTEFKKVNKFTYGYAITVYKSQGSQFENVLYYRDTTSPKLQKRSDYVAATRAEESLLYFK